MTRKRRTTKRATKRKTTSRRTRFMTNARKSAKRHGGVAVLL